MKLQNQRRDIVHGVHHKYFLLGNSCSCTYNISPIEFRREVIIHFWELVSDENGSEAIDDSIDDSKT